MILVDTSALVALVDPRDQWHGSAASTWARLRRSNERFVLTDLILSELLALLRRRAGHKIALAAGELVMTSGVVELVFLDPVLLQGAWGIFRRHRDREFSLTDCVSFALMRTRKIAEAFSFDDDFRSMGFFVHGLT